MCVMGLSRLMNFMGNRHNQLATFPFLQIVALYLTPLQLTNIHSFVT